jgi:hypothetical protein
MESGNTGSMTSDCLCKESHVAVSPIVLQHSDPCESTRCRQIMKEPLYEKNNPYIAALGQRLDGACGG